MTEQRRGEPSGYAPATTTDEVLDGVDLTGTDVLVTGASAGLGLETSRALAARGTHVIMACPTRRKGRRPRLRSVRTCRRWTSSFDPSTSRRPGSVRAFAESFLADHDRLHVLVANAGVMACPASTTADGFETQLGTNHLGHFL